MTLAQTVSINLYGLYSFALSRGQAFETRAPDGRGSWRQGLGHELQPERPLKPKPLLKLELVYRSTFSSTSRCKPLLNLG